MRLRRFRGLSIKRLRSLRIGGMGGRRRGSGRNRKDRREFKNILKNDHQNQVLFN